MSSARLVKIQFERVDVRFSERPMTRAQSIPINLIIEKPWTWYTLLRLAWGDVNRKLVPSRFQTKQKTFSRTKKMFSTAH